MIEEEKKVHEYLKNKGFSTGEAFLISDAIRKDLPLDEFTDKKYDYSQMRVLKSAIENGKSIKYVKNIEMSAAHMELIIELQDSIDVEDLLDTSLTTAQVRCCGQAKQMGMDHTVFIKFPKFAAMPHAIELHKLYNLEDYSWVNENLSEKSFGYLADLLIWGEDITEYVSLTEYEIFQEWQRIHQLRIDTEKFSMKNLKRFKLFKNLNL